MAADSKGTANPHPRPLSPHLQVYRLPMLAILSITHRATGVGLAVGTLMLVCWLVAAANGEAAFNSVNGFLGSAIGRLLLFGWSVALFFHLANGIRHLFWDAVMGFEIRSAENSGWAVIAFTAVATLLAWSIGLAVAGGN
ncbi:MAG: succinate dehydrogenase, cytochrome b556 subunit [Alphaproteobacteria bacterium]|nr:succinate dehydrogenase, cytochrome b556 subunit [Alphaproteobacteria bacterium]